MNTFQEIWHRVTEPSNRVTDLADRQQATLIAGLLFVWALLLCVFCVIWLVISYSEITPTLVGLAVSYILVTVGLYRLSRSQYACTSLRIFIALSYLMIAGVYLFVDLRSPEHALNFFAMLLLIAGFVFSVRQTALLLLWIEATLFVLPALRPDVSHNIWDMPLIIAAIGILTLVMMAVNEHYRRLALEGERRFRALMEANREGTLIIESKKGRILDSNTAFERIVGYSHSEVVSKLPVDFVIPANKEATLEHWRKRTIGTIEATMQHKDGHLVDVEVSMYPYVYQDQPAYVIIVHDVSDRKQAERALNASERRFQAIFNQTFQFMGVMEPDGTISEINESTLKFFGLAQEDVIGKRMWEIPAFNDGSPAGQRLRPAIMHAAAGTFMRFEAELRDRHGMRTYVDFSIKPVFDDQGHVIMLIPEGRDITARRFAEYQRIEHEQRYQALFAHTADAVCIVDTNGIIASVNDQALKIFRCEKHEIIGKNYLSFMADEEFSASSEVFQRIKSGVDAPPVIERRMRRHDGEVFVAEISAMLVKDAADNPLYVQSMIRDTSERQRTEQQRFQLRLERERTKMLEGFIDQASHHFRTPLTNIKTSIYLLPRLQSPEKQEQHFQILHNEVDRLENLLEDLLTVSRLQKDDSEYHIGRVFTNPLLREIQSYHHGRRGYENHQWQWIEHPEETTSIMGDRQRLGKAIFILVDNAVRYTPDGGQITVRSFSHGAWVVFEVHDTGIGIQETDLPFVFDEFYRTEEARERDSTSSGLGLSICRKIIERHQGAVRIASTIGAGTTVQIALPILDEWGSEPPLLMEQGLLLPMPKPEQQLK